MLFFLPATAWETLCVGAGVVVTAAFVVVPGTVQHKKIKLGFLQRLGPVHLHPNLEVPRLTCPGQESNLGLRGRR